MPSARNRILAIALAAIVADGTAAAETDTRLHADGQGWRLDKARISDPGRPRVLLIGDSILNGYRTHVIRALGGKAYVDTWVNPYHQSEHLNKLLDQVLQHGPYDVVHFNMGLHGWPEGRIKPGTFEPLTKAYVEVIRQRLPNAKIIWASSTPVTKQGTPTELEPDINPIIVEHNRVAAEVMADMNVPVNDLYGLLVDKLELARGDRFHWTAPAYEILAKKVTESVLRELQNSTTTQADADTPLNERQARPSPDWVTSGVMYQIQPRAFTPEGTLQAATARLPKVAELGIDIIYMCPVFMSDDDPDRNGWSPRQKKSGMNNPHNPYRMKDYYHVDPEYGTDDDLQEFIAEAHKLGMRILLDMVYLHCGPNAVFLKEHPNFVKRDDKGKIVTAAWGFPAINHANPELHEYLWDNMEYWVTEFGADGFRCDVSDGIPLDFWETARARLEKIRPDVCMLAEGGRREDQLKAFDLDYGWGFQWDNAAKFRAHWEKVRDERPRGGARFIRFIDNHDIANDDYDDRIEKAWGSRRVQAALVALFTLDGVPMIYNGQEVADTARHSIFGRSPIDWANGNTPPGKARYAFCKQLCQMRRAERALTYGAVVWLDHDQPDDVLAYVRALDNAEILTVVNLTQQQVEVRIAMPPTGTLAARELLAHGAKEAPARDGKRVFVLDGNGFFVGRG